MYYTKYFNIKKFLFLVSSDICNEELTKIDKFISILNKSGIGIIIKNEKKKKGRYGYNTYDLVATIIYCFSQFRSSLREIDDLCKFDLIVIYLMHQVEPSHNAIKECINKYILPHQYEMFTLINKTIKKEFDLDVSNQYLDGTKIEANANKYKFVWKPTTHHKNLDIKIKNLLLEFNISFPQEKLIKSYELNEIVNKYVIDNAIEVCSIPNGTGKRLTKEQKTHKFLYC